MSKEFYEAWSPQEETLAMLAHISRIMDEYQEDGYTLTVRQLYYQLVGRDLLPDTWWDDEAKSTNNIKSYNKIKDYMRRGRLAGFLDWDMVEDRTRRPVTNNHFPTPAALMRAAIRSFYHDKWFNQQYHIEVWAEKDAVSSILEPLCSRWDVLYMANRGYSSISAQRQSARRLIKANDDGKMIVILYVGDHDPSGVDMDRDIRDKMELFGVSVPVIRLALTMDQVNEFDLPPNPAKESDSRIIQYAERFGDESWELDALAPRQLEGIVEDGIRAYLDEDKFQVVAEYDAAVKAKLREPNQDFGFTARYDLWVENRNGGSNE